MPDRTTILFDGICMFCNRTVLFIIRRDPEKIFTFSPRQSRIAQELMITHGLVPDETDSLILIRGDRCFVRSEAVLEIASMLGGIWRLLWIFRIIPRSVRDRLYDGFAARRYRWFGRRDECMIPDPFIADRFLG